MTNFSIIEVNDDSWNTTINKCINHDFYHTQAYHQLEKENRPVLFVLNFDEETVALPLIIRSIPNSELFDCTSVYGYGGPISSIPLESVPQECIIEFQNQLTDYFRSNNIVTAFSRLHPLISTGRFFDDFGTVKALNKTVAINLQLDADEQRRQFRKSTKSELNQLRKNGYEVKIADTKEEINAFIEIYHETMDRVDASEHYFFDNDYFYDFLDNDEFRAKVLVAKFDNKVIAGAIFTVANKIIQYHLAGTTEQFIKVTPMKLIIDEARLRGNALQLNYLHLGGGVGGSDDDSLFKFKAGFSKEHFQYNVWQMIVNEEQYDYLKKRNNSDPSSDFFPLYRS